MMPKTKDFEDLSPARKRAYRAIWTLYTRKGASPSTTEIAKEADMTIGNLHPIILWLESHLWISRIPNQHRSIVPLVKLRVEVSA
jgi:DNA-binding MarR family transcriptional regulator